jgi:glycosyltransferase involved in cell wall biosynthesis
VLLSRRSSAPPAVFYGYRRIPGLGERTHGGMIKIQRMQPTFPNSRRRFDTLYLVSSAVPEGASMMAWLARRRGRRFVWNQDGVAYRGWHGPGWEETNAHLARLLRGADHVFYQSEFCKRAADLFLGPPRGTWEVLYNPVDTGEFAPTDTAPDGTLVLLLGGSQDQRYRFESAVATLARLLRRGVRARLMVTGRLGWGPLDDAASEAARLLSKHGVAGQVDLLGPYAQRDAPAILRRAHILLHTKYNDPCPGIVLESLSCGLPVVYSASGGVPELVGAEAGIGVPAELSWEEPIVPDPDALADGVLRVLASWPQFSRAARRRAVERFDIGPWLERHHRVFEAGG